MLIEQIIDFNWGAWAPWPNMLLELVIFMIKQKCLTKIFEWIII